MHVSLFIFTSTNESVCVYVSLFVYKFVSVLVCTYVKVIPLVACRCVGLGICEIFHLCVVSGGTIVNYSVSKVKHM